MKNKKIYFYGEVNNQDKNSFSVDTSGASFRELAELLANLEMVKIRITQHLLDLVPNWQIEEKHDGEEEEDAP